MGAGRTTSAGDSKRKRTQKGEMEGIKEQETKQLEEKLRLGKLFLKNNQLFLPVRKRNQKS